MSAIRIVVRVTPTGFGGTPRAIRLLNLAVQPDHLAGWLSGTVVGILQARAHTRFDTEGDDAVGGPWEPLSPVTVKIRESIGFPGAHPINHRTGQLRNFVTGDQGVLTSSAGSVLLSWPREPGGRMLKKLTTAQSGNDRAPARPVLGVDFADAELIAQSLRAHLFAVMRAGRT